MLRADIIHVQNKRSRYTGRWVAVAVQPTDSIACCCILKTELCYGLGYLFVMFVPYETDKISLNRCFDVNDSFFCVHVSLSCYKWMATCLKWAYEAMVHLSIHRIYINNKPSFRKVLYQSNVKFQCQKTTMLCTSWFSVRWIRLLCYYVILARAAVRTAQIFCMEDCRQQQTKQATKVMPRLTFEQ